jgi:hypothetical protein
LQCAPLHCCRRCELAAARGGLYRAVKRGAVVTVEKRELVLLARIQIGFSGVLILFVRPVIRGFSILLIGGVQLVKTWDLLNFINHSFIHMLCVLDLILYKLMHFEHSDYLN